MTTSQSRQRAASEMDAYGRQPNNSPASCSARAATGHRPGRLRCARSAGGRRQRATPPQLIIASLYLCTILPRLTCGDGPVCCIQDLVCDVNLDLALRTTKAPA